MLFIQFELEIFKNIKGLLNLILKFNFRKLLESMFVSPKFSKFN